MRKPEIASPPAAQALEDRLLGPSADPGPATLVPPAVRRDRSMRPTAIADDVTLNVDQAADAAGVSRRVLYYWMQHGKLAFTIVRGSRRVTLADVVAVKQWSWAGRAIGRAVHSG